MHDNCEKAAASLLVAVGHWGLLSDFWCFPTPETIPKQKTELDMEENGRAEVTLRKGECGGFGGGRSAANMTFGNESLLKCTPYLSRRETLIKTRRGLFLRRGCWRRWRRKSLRRGRETSHHLRRHCLSSWGTSQHGKFYRLHRGTNLTHQV